MITPSSSAASRPLRRPNEADLLYGAVIRPPHYRMCADGFYCDELAGVDQASVAEVAGLRQVVRRGNFVGVIADQPDAARRAAALLQVSWRPGAVNEPPALAETPAVKTGEGLLGARYGWPNRIRWGQRTGWAIAEPQEGALQVWVDSATPDLLRADLAALAGLAVEQVQVIGAAGGAGRTCADDAAADAALLAIAAGRAVAVELSPDYTADVEALGMARQLALSVHWMGQAITDYEQSEEAVSVAPVLALLLTGTPAPADFVEPIAEFPYRFATVRVTTPTKSSGHQLPELDGLQRTFARECFIDEVAHEIGADPVALRRRHVHDERGRILLDSVARQAGWGGDRPVAPAGEDIRYGRGVAYTHTPAPEGESEDGTRSAWVADVEVNHISGEVRLTRLVVGQDSGQAVDPEAVKVQLQQELLGQTQPLLLSRGAFDDWGVEDTTNTAEGLSTQLQSVVPPPLATLSAPAETRVAPATLEPGVAVIANAIFDATGVRLRQPPFTPDRLRSALECSASTPDGKGGKGRWRAWYAATLASAVGLLVLASPWRPAIEPIARPVANVYSAATVERGRLVAEAGDCVVCHTMNKGTPNVGGRAFETPFGLLYSTNLTPDPQTGIGNWSYTAFERAMREGISRDGHHLYPAFPYTAFAKISDADMQALYAYLMAQPAVRAETPKAELSFPFGFRPLMAGWNILFHNNKRFKPDPTRSARWNRGAYLVEGLGHCSACHTPRNVLGAERGGKARYAGAVVDGWEAPALSELSRSPVPWTEESLYRYLRNGFDPDHGVAGGPMAPVVEGLAELPEEDVKAIASYIASLAGEQRPAQRSSETLSQSAAATAGSTNGARIYEHSCAACHESQVLTSITDARTSLALNTNLHSDKPHNVIQSILHGLQPAGEKLSDMPAFSDSFNDRQIVDLVGYLRGRFAPQRAAWQDVEKIVRELRHQGPR